MGTLIKIAWRNVRRHKRRSFLSALVISAGLSIYIFMNSIMAGMDRANLDSLIELSTSSIKISTEQYAEDKESLPLKYGIPDAGQLLAYIKEQQHVISATPRTQFLGQLSNWEDTMPVIGQVINIKTDNIQNEWGKHNLYVSLKYLINDLMNVSAHIIGSDAGGNDQMLMYSGQFYYNILQNVNVIFYTRYFSYKEEIASAPDLEYAVRVEVKF